MYMSYCRFEGTLQELRGCLRNVEEHICGEAEYEVSKHEIECFRQMVVEFWDWMRDNDLLDDEGYIDEDELYGICNDMTKSREDWEHDDI